jgi:uncharacterized integral membrane protein
VNPVLWLILGLLLGAGIYWLASRTSFGLSWYEWVLAVLGVILIMFAIQNYGASQVELEPRAAGIMLWLFALPGLILGVVAGVLAWLRLHKVAV